MSALIFALALVSAQEPATATVETPAPIVQAAPLVDAPPPSEETVPKADPAPETPVVAEVKAAELPFPVGSPTDDYGLVAWCYGALGGYLDLHDRVLPEVSRIESAYRRPGTSLSDDMSTYADMQKISRTNMKLFAAAMEAAERASLQPINIRGAASVKKGRASWAGADALPVRAVAQQWMGWALPVRCTPTAVNLEIRAKLLATAFQANAAQAEPLAKDMQSETVAASAESTESDPIQVPVSILP